MDISTRDSCLWLAVFISCLRSVAVAERSLPCEFPVSWRGHWHQARLGKISITDEVISKKGTCIENYGDYYLMENTEEGCVSCLLMLRRHDNIIQYKESYCGETNNLRSMCTYIQVEAIMYTLVKEPTQTIPCPFPDNYHVTYDEGFHGHHGSCDTPRSYVTTCGTAEHTMGFHFEHCNPQAVWSGHDLQFECLATWKEGSEDFLYGRFSGDVIMSKDDSYRCFKYDARGVVIQAAMSADATCRGLISPLTGPVVMSLQKDTTSEPEPGCTYPLWLTSSRWQDYTGDVTVTFHGHKQKLSLQTSAVHERLICQQLRTLDVDEYVVAAYFAQNCGATYQCLYFKRLNDRAFTLRRSDVTEHALDAYACTSRQPRDADVTVTFISGRVMDDPLGCPNPGVYSYQDPSRDCDVHVFSGCATVTSILVKPQCQSVSDVSLECITYWSVDGSTYWVVRNTHDVTLHCVVLYELSPNNYTMESCSHAGSRALFHNVLVQKHGSCHDKIPTRPVVIDGSSPTVHPSTQRKQPPDKHVTTTNHLPYHVPSTRLQNTHTTVAPSRGKNINSDETQTSQQYSLGASSQYISHGSIVMLVVLSLVVFMTPNIWL